MTEIIITTTYAALHDAVIWTAPAAHTDDAFPTLTAIKLDWGDEAACTHFRHDLQDTLELKPPLTLWATDKHRIHWSSIDAAITGTDGGSILIPADTLKRAMQHMRNTEKDLDLSPTDQITISLTGDGECTLETGTWRVTLAAYDGIYPNLNLITNRKINTPTKPKDEQQPDSAQSEIRTLNPRYLHDITEAIKNLKRREPPVELTIRLGGRPSELLRFATPVPGDGQHSGLLMPIWPAQIV